MNSLRISGDLPELHLDLQINHEAGRALVSLVDAGHTWSCFQIIATIESQPTTTRISLGRASIPS